MDVWLYGAAPAIRKKLLSSGRHADSLHNRLPSHVSELPHWACVELQKSDHLGTRVPQVFGLSHVSDRCTRVREKLQQQRNYSKPNRIPVGQHVLNRSISKSICSRKSSGIMGLTGTSRTHSFPWFLNLIPLNNRAFI